ncbi:SPOSA6832_00359 [Sporobolomyces salmonicolor]|uniref:SPOSA6832_00359-mRNA-1:cds n=1 Tax=Sporidiobolus salmonicolor TaxID=5005 RepID=A0A0D6EGI4_SPOSA|nr:SPOSA6832_00359 [Sporobolomyces salmonicolor]
MSDRKQAVVAALQGLATSFGELAKAHRAAQSAIHEYSVEIDQTDSPQDILANFPALFGDLEVVAAAAGGKLKQAISPEDEEGEGKKRKRGPNKEKKVKDPNAPKRPASAYIEYQNSVRDEYRRKYPDLPYAEVLKKIGLVWQAMSDEQKKPWNDITDGKRVVYAEEKKNYESVHGPPQTVPAATNGEGKEYTGKKRGRKSNAERAALAAAAAVAAEPAGKEADIPVEEPKKKAAASPVKPKKTPLEESDEDDSSEDESSDDDSDDSDDDDSDEEDLPQPSPVKKEKTKKNGDKHKAKKVKA